MLGRSEDEMLRLSFQEITHPDDLKPDVAQANRLLAGEIESYQIEKRYIHTAGHSIWGLLTISLVRNVAGAPSYFIGQIVGIAAHKEALQSVSQHAADLERSNAELEPSTTIPLRVVRNGQATTVNVALGVVRSGVRPTPPAAIDGPARAGLQATERGGRVVITGVSRTRRRRVPAFGRDR